MADEPPRIMTPEEWQRLLDHMDALIRQNHELQQKLDAAMKQRPYFPDRRLHPRHAA